MTVVVQRGADIPNAHCVVIGIELGRGSLVCHLLKDPLVGKFTRADAVRPAAGAEKSAVSVVRADGLKTSTRISQGRLAVLGISVEGDLDAERGSYSV